MSIPRHIHRIWLGSDEPRWSREFCRGWFRPGWKVSTWYTVPAEIRPLYNQETYDAAPEIAPDHVGQLRSDILRLEILAHFGGVYVDADFESVRDISPLLGEGTTFFAAWEIPGLFVNNAVMGSEPEHPLIVELIEGLAFHVKRNAGRKPNHLSGPRFLTSVLGRGDPEDVPWVQREGIEIFDKELFYPYGWEEIAEHEPGESFPDAYAVHHWANKRRERQVAGL